MPKTFKTLVGRAWRQLFPRPVYVVTYDITDLEGEDHGEQYYGYFASPAEARTMFNSLRGRDPRYVNARVMKQVDRIEDLSSATKAVARRNGVFEGLTGDGWFQESPR